MPALFAFHPNFWDMNSTDLFKMFCRLCMKSSDWWAKENECRDSEGNRLRSSVKLSVGEEGPELMAKEGVRGFGSASVIEAVRGPTDGLREEDPEEGNVGARGGGCCRIRRRPEAPSPCSCSVMTGDLEEEFGQFLQIYRSCREIRDIGPPAPNHMPPCSHERRRNSNNEPRHGIIFSCRQARIGETYSSLLQTFRCICEQISGTSILRDGEIGRWGRLAPASFALCWICFDAWIEENGHVS